VRPTLVAVFHCHFFRWHVYSHYRTHESRTAYRGHTLPAEHTAIPRVLLHFVYSLHKGCVHFLFNYNQSPEEGSKNNSRNVVCIKHISEDSGQWQWCRDVWILLHFTKFFFFHLRMVIFDCGRDWAAQTSRIFCCLWFFFFRRYNLIFTRFGLLNI
jgi:hypothetical protein